MKYTLAIIPLLLILVVVPTAHASIDILGGLEDIAEYIAIGILDTEITFVPWFTITALNLEDVYDAGKSYSVITQVESIVDSFEVTTLIESYNQENNEWTIIISDTIYFENAATESFMYKVDIPSNASHLLIQVSAESTEYHNTKETEKWLRNVT